MCPVEDRTRAPRHSTDGTYNRPVSGRSWLLAGVLFALLPLAGCGRASKPAPAPLRLTIDSPLAGATTLAPQVLVRGTVSSRTAAVLVGGRAAAVRGGSFGAWVSLRPGSNLIDVLAGAPHARAAMSAVRVYRELPVTVPDVSGQSSTSAGAALRRLGLRPQVTVEGGFFQSLLPLSRHVCATQPPAGRLLAPGSTVAVRVAKVC